MTAMPQDVTGQISVLINSVGLLVQMVHITNTGSPLSGPIYLVFDQLPSSMLTNATGVTALDAPTGSPYIEIDTGLATGGSLLVKLMITDPDDYGIRYAIRVLSGGTGVL